MNKSRSGFTLIEISIVIVIIGMIIGGVIVGQNMVTNSRTQSVVADIGDFQNAIKLFSDKYKYLPGDFPDAEAVWGTHASGCPNVNTASTTNTCNGDGDGFVATAATPTPIRSSISAENYYAWKHLANAGLLKITYDKTGYGRPASKIEGNMYTLFYSRGTGSVAGVFNAKYGHIITYGASFTNSTYPAYAAGITGAQASSIDQKMDDGRPGTGMVMSYTTNVAAPTPSCATSSTQTSALYSTTGSTNICSLIFMTGY